MIKTASLTRPADTTAYASGDLVANSTTAANVVPMSFESYGDFFVKTVKLAKSGTSTTNASFRVHLFASSPSVANGDNGAFSCSGVAGYIGSYDVTIDQAFTDGACGFGVPNVGSEHNFQGTSNNIYALLEARAAYTPSSAEVFSLTLERYKV